MNPNPSIKVRIVISRWLLVEFAQPVVGFVEKVFHRLCFEPERADDRDCKFVSIGRAHLGKVIATNLRVSSKESVSLGISNEVTGVAEQLPRHL
jgi:hypothetical protein